MPAESSAYLNDLLRCSGNPVCPLAAKNDGYLNGAVSMAISDAPTTDELRRLVVASMRDRLPKNWKVTEVLEPQRGAARPDAEVNIDAPDGSIGRLNVEVKQVLERRDVARVAERARNMSSGPADTPVIAARYLASSVRDALAAEGVSYVDATGNMRLVLDKPAIFVSSQGEERDPWRKGRPRGTLKGEPAARISRALLDYRREWTVRELVAESGSSIGAAYRVLEYLEGEGLVVKEDKRYRVTDWERLLRAWSADASFQTTTRTMAYIDPRGVDNLLSKIGKQPPFPVAVTGSAAAKEWAGYAPTKAAYVYVSSIQEASGQWGLRPNSAAPNVILLEPRTIGDVPFANATLSTAGYPVAAPAQVAADLLNGPGREPAEGEFLIEWMKANEEKWRRD